MMRAYLPLLIPVVVALAACSPSQDSEPAREPSSADQPAMDSADFEASESSADLRSSRAPAAPGIVPTAAPGVAFNYRYGFRLPAQHIAAVQRQHAAACEKLGIDRCRITGMHYRLVNDRDIEGMLAFKLDPMIARKFGSSLKASMPSMSRSLTRR